MANILVGNSSWTDKSLIDSGCFYPASARTPEDRLRYYASQFPIVEIDSSYYGIPIEQNARLWVERTPPEFVFNIKTYRLFTRHQTPVEPREGHPRRARSCRQRRTSTTKTCRRRFNSSSGDSFAPCSRCCVEPARRGAFPIRAVGRLSSEE